LADKKLLIIIANGVRIFTLTKPMQKTKNLKTKWIEDEIEKIKASGLFINTRTIESPMGARIKIEGKSVLNFCANNYLGLANHPQIKTAAKKAIDKYGVGPAAVRTIAGTTVLHKQLEESLAKFKKAEDVITFQSGFTANLATIPALVGEGDIIFSDELNHASIIDGCRLSKAQVVRFNHKDTKDLEAKIKENSTLAKKLIITDGVFSMDGDIAPLPDIYKVAEKYNCILMVDDAHGEGVLGEGGRGIVDHFKLHGKVDVEVGTMSKAFGVVGGMVAGKKIIIDWLRQKARPFLFSSAMTIPDVAACIEAVNILQKSQSLIKKLWDNTSYFKKKMALAGFNIGESKTPIVPLMLGEAFLAKEFSKKLLENGVFAMAITYPTVPMGKARVRVMMSSSHSKSDLDEALEIFKKVGKELRVIK
jgi:glycine C-acetyltransferase